MINIFRDENRFLSNFYPVKISFQGIWFPSVENAYVASKSLKRSDWEKVSQMSAGESKRYGRKTIELRKDFDDIKLHLMEDFLRQKFSYSDLITKLFNTGNQPLVEGNYWHDNFWGSCYCVKCNNSGNNNLGKLLMKIRGEL